MNPSFLNKDIGYQISTHLEFERLWGLGTSSTLINNIAQWAHVNPFKLLNKSFGGSGYDIAAAEEKKDSKEAIKNYRSQPKASLSSVIEKINTITEEISVCNDFDEFERLLSTHEKIISNLLNCSTIQEDRFKDFSGVVKSLGGWGGDFVLATGSLKKMDYFKNKGYTIIINYSDIIINY